MADCNLFFIRASMKDLYLISYNTSCIAGWSYVLLLFSQHVFSEVLFSWPILSTKLSGFYNWTQDIDPSNPW